MARAKALGPESHGRAAVSVAEVDRGPSRGEEDREVATRLGAAGFGVWAKSRAERWGRERLESHMKMHTGGGEAPTSCLIIPSAVATRPSISPQQRWPQAPRPWAWDSQGHEQVAPCGPQGGLSKQPCPWCWWGGRRGLGHCHLRSPARSQGLAAFLEPRSPLSPG